MDQQNSFTIYNASAGSGKTFTLVKEYLKLLLVSKGYNQYRHILSITFTNKAVAEMKSRILESLHQLSKGMDQDNPLLQLLISETGLSFKEIQSKSKGILKNILNDYAAFEISTIDGFTHRVLRTFSKDLDLPMNFEVELNTEDVLQEAVDRLINKAGEEPSLTRVLVQFVLEKIDDDRSWDVARDLLNTARLLTEETSLRYLARLREHSQEDFLQADQKVKEEIELGEKAMQNTAEEFFELIYSKGLEATDFSRGSCPGFFKKIIKEDYNIGLQAVWQQKIATDKLYTNKVDRWKKEVMDEVQAEIAELFFKARHLLLRRQFLQAVKKNFLPLSLLSAIQDEIEEIKKEKSFLLISEFNSRIAEAVKDQPVPFIYERLGERYRHFFIDEFQDTSQMQWENLIPLVEHTLSTEHPKNENGGLTLVGDAKQSIYRWRGGKAEQFMELCGEKNPFSLEQKEVVMLPRNYRSSRAVVDFNNGFFRFASECFEQQDHQELFYGSTQEGVRQDEGYVNLSFVAADTAAEEMEEYPARVLDILQELQKQNVPRKQICILVRKRKEGVAIANTLSDNGIPVISSESLLVSRSPEVQFIVAVLNFSINPDDKENKFKILDFLLHEKIETRDETSFLCEALQRSGQSFFQTLETFGTKFDLEVLQALSLYEGVEYLIRSFELVTDSNAYLQFFLDFVYESTHSAGLGVPSFLDVWEQKKDKLTIVVPEGEDAVQIMTIHSSKGLEFPVVIYPFADGSIRDISRESFWTDIGNNLNSGIDVARLRASAKMVDWENPIPQLYESLCSESQLDAINVLYVALTRAVERLYIITKMELDKKGNENRNKFSGLFISYLKYMGMWNGGDEYSFGNIPDVNPERQEPNFSVQPRVFHSTPTASNGVLIVTRSAMMWDPHQQSAVEKGKMIHELFSKIQTSGDVQEVLDYGHREGFFPAEQKDAVGQVLYNVVEHPDLRSFFSEGGKHYKEKDIISSDGRILRPDRLSFFGKKVSIIDYKTGAPGSQHHDQLNEYASVLEEMGFDVDQKVLVYINEEATLEII